ncbi:hypothetical protein FHS25_004417 [Rhizobium laguerreae]|uniref:Uncharacterized protein n=1 Tax=Rhizobium laguerreae TaxID=1076926 RepID=A0ABR6GEZ1_9HYPH|nr:hypothetical protein [Rhizobium laguerreae]
MTTTDLLFKRFDPWQHIAAQLVNSINERPDTQNQDVASLDGSETEPRPSIDGRGSAAGAGRSVYPSAFGGEEVDFLGFGREVDLLVRL